MEDGNGNVVSVEKVVDKKELAKQRKAFLARERRHAEKLIRERRKQIEFVVVNRESENIIEGEAVKKIVSISDLPEKAKQRKTILQRERRDALKLSSVVVNEDDEHEIASMGDHASNAVELAKQRNTMLRRERRNALKRSSVDICSDEEEFVRKQKRNEEQRKRYDADKRHAQRDEDKEREKKFLLLSL